MHLTGDENKSDGNEHHLNTILECECDRQTDVQHFHINIAHQYADSWRNTARNTLVSLV